MRRAPMRGLDGPGQRRNGRRPRDFDARAGSTELALPGLSQGIWFPDWLLEPRRRAERALAQVVAVCHVRGVSAAGSKGRVLALDSEGCPSPSQTPWPPTWTTRSRPKASGPSRPAHA
jgi:hypothetical protein